MKNNEESGCIVLVVAFMMVVVAVFASFYFKSQCYDFHTQYGYETRYGLGSGCEALIGEKWVMVWYGSSLKIDDIVQYLPEAE